MKLFYNLPKPFLIIFILLVTDHDWPFISLELLIFDVLLFCLESSLSRTVSLCKTYSVGIQTILLQLTEALPDYYFIGDWWWLVRFISDIHFRNLPFLLIIVNFKNYFPLQGVALAFKRFFYNFRCRSAFLDYVHLTGNWSWSVRFISAIHFSNSWLFVKNRKFLELVHFVRLSAASKELFYNLPKSKIVLISFASFLF